MNSSISQVQNPNYDCNQLVNNYNPPYSDIVNFLMSDDDDEAGSQEINNKLKIEEAGYVSENVTNSTSLGSSSAASTPLIMEGKIKSCRRDKEEELQEHRFAFRTKTNIEFMDDGYKWRKYGKKKVKSSPNPRNYFKCSSGGCCVKKRVERDKEDPSFVITTYQGMHNHETPNCVHYYSQQPSSILRTSSSI